MSETHTPEKSERDCILPLLKDSLQSFKGNHTHLFGNLYLVKTQAGLKQAIKDFSNARNWWRDTQPTFAELLLELNFQEIPDLKNFSYPFVLEIVPIYIGYHAHSVIIKSI